MPLWSALLIFKRLEGDFGCQPVVGAKGSSTAVAVAERCAGILGRVEIERVLQFVADAAALHVDCHGGLVVV